MKRMTIKKKEYENYLKWVDEMFDKKVKANSAESQNIQVALLRIQVHVDKSYPIPVTIEVSNLDRMLL
jgi:lysine/ornithine N-monooxygenase